jgi:nucleotide-binding universal stress UspA family protein
MFKHIFVPLDGSRLAEAALPAAAYFARCFGAQVSLVHLIEKGRPQTVHEQPHLHDEKEAAEYLAKAASSFPAGTAVECHVHTDEVSHVAQSIVDHCITELHSDFVIMCTHGSDGTRRFVSGSIAQQVIASGTVPVLAVHSTEQAPATEDAQSMRSAPFAEFSCGKILVPLGGQRDHGDILQAVEEFAKCCGAIVRLLSVVPTFDSIPGKWFQVGRLLPGTTAEMLDIEAEETAGLLQARATVLRAGGVAAEVKVLRGDPGHFISVDAEESNAALIVMATHGKAGMAALWEGSVAPKVFAESKKPILLLPVAEETKD